MEEDLVALLLGDTGVAAAVGSAVHWDVLPQGATRPAIVLNLVDGVPDYVLSGASGLVASRVQADCQAASKAAALAAGRALKAALGGFRGVAGGTRFGGCFVALERQSFEKPDEGSEAWRQVSIDFVIWHGPAT